MILHLVELAALLLVGLGIVGLGVLAPAPAKQVPNYVRIAELEAELGLPPTTDIKISGPASLASADRALRETWDPRYKPRLTVVPPDLLDADWNRRAAELRDRHER
jgi:hypothetical protein